MKSIIKRDGKEMPFDESKIFNAIYAANKAVDGEKMTSIDFTYLTKKVVEQLDGETCTVEQVQDIVEAMLIKYDWEKTAKAYILYRAEHAKIREAESDLMNIYNELTYSYSKDADIKRAIDFIVSEEMMAVGCKENLERLYNELLNKDWFMTLPDFKDYVATKERIYADYEDRMAWAKKMLVNISKAGFFSSDRTIAQYNEDIWHL